MPARRSAAMTRTTQALSIAAATTVVAACSFVAFKRYKGEAVELPKVVSLFRACKPHPDACARPGARIGRPEGRQGRRARGMGLPAAAPQGAAAPPPWLK